MHTPQKTCFPFKNDRKGKDKVRFTKTCRQLPLPFHIVADTEALLVKNDSCSPDSELSSTSILNHHVPCGIAYKVCCTDPRFFKDPVIITKEKDGKSIMEQFLDSLQKEASQIREILKHRTPMLPLTDAELEMCDSPNPVCHICEKPIAADQIKCRDHDHLSGLFRGLTHQSCNLNFQINPEKIQIPCFFHNLKNYDSHLIISAAKRSHGEIKVIPTTTEKYISFSIGDIIFKDSYAFTQSSLESLAGNLKKDQFIHMRRWIEKRIVDEADKNLGNVVSAIFQTFLYLYFFLLHTLVPVLTSLILGYQCLEQR